MYIHVYTYAYTYTYTYTYTYMYICMYACMYVYTSVQRVLVKLAVEAETLFTETPTSRLRGRVGLLQ